LHIHRSKDSIDVTTRNYRKQMAVQTQREDGQPRAGADRVLRVLRELAGHPDGATLQELAGAVGSPKSSVHRALGALRRAELATQLERGRYALSSEFIRLAYAHHEARSEPRVVAPCLDELAETFGEAAHYAELEGAEVIYRAKVNPAGQSVQMSSTIGGRNPAYCTGVGKALIAHRVANDDAARSEERFGPFEQRTAHTLVDPAALLADLELTRTRGYALDDQENELGINCIAFPLFLASPSVPSGAISIAGLAHRTPLRSLEERAHEIRAVIHKHLGEVTG
jgi:IclR family transcriptional regulator, acetate operon repressor